VTCRAAIAANIGAAWLVWATYDDSGDGMLATLPAKQALA